MSGWPQTVSATNMWHFSSETIIFAYSCGLFQRNQLDMGDCMWCGRSKRKSWMWLSNGVWISVGRRKQVQVTRGLLWSSICRICDGLGGTRNQQWKFISNFSRYVQFAWLRCCYFWPGLLDSSPQPNHFPETSCSLSRLSALVCSGYLPLYIRTISQS